MGLSTNTYTYSGGSKQFSATFADGYIEQSHVTAYVVGAVDGLGDQVYLNFTWTSESQITVTDSLTVGDEVTVERTVPKDNVLVDLDENGAITREGLSRNNRQALHAVHEVFDGRLENNLISAVNSLLERVNAIDTQVALVEGLAEDTMDYSLAAAQSALDAALVANSAASLLRNTTLLADGSDTYSLEHDLPIGLVFIDGVQQNWDAFVHDQLGREILFSENVVAGAEIEVLYSAGTAAYSLLTVEDTDSFFSNTTISYSNTAIGVSVVDRKEGLSWVLQPSNAVNAITVNGVAYYPGGAPLPAHFGIKNDGATEQSAKLQAYADYLEMVSDSGTGVNTLDRVKTATLLIPEGDGVVIDTPVSVARGVNIIMKAPILVKASASAAETWVRVAADDGVGQNAGRACEYEIDVRRLTQSNWNDADDIGFLLEDSVSHKTYLKRLDHFHTGAKVTTAYSDLLLGEFRDNCHGCYIRHSSDQFTNAVSIRGGEFAVINGANNGKSRYGIFVEDGGLGTGVNSLRFYGQSFELSNGSAIDGNPSAESIPYVLSKCSQSTFKSIRMENTGTIVARLTDDCRSNDFELIYGRELDIPPATLLDDQSTYKLHNIALLKGTPHSHTVFDSGLLSKRVFYANAGTSYSIRGMDRLLSNGGLGTAASRVSKFNLTGSQPNDNGSISTGQVIGVTVKTDIAKNFIVSIDKLDDPVAFIVAYDENGDQLTANTDVLQNAATPTINATTGSYGGYYGLSGAWDGAAFYRKLTFSDRVKEVYIGITGTNLRALRILSVGAITTAYALDDAMYVGRTERSPLQGDLITGTVAFYDNASAGGAPGYYVTQGGHLTRTLTGSPRAATTSGSSVITLTGADDAKVGMYIDIAGVTGSFRILARQGSWVKLDRSADATVASGVVSFTTPIIKNLANMAV